MKITPPTKQAVTIWPREDRASGMVRDTEPGLQPWPAKLVRVEYKDGQWYGVVIESRHSRSRSHRFVPLDLIRPDHRGTK
jgi:hypothetical protein